MNANGNTLTVDEKTTSSFDAKPTEWQHESQQQFPVKDSNNNLANNNFNDIWQNRLLQRQRAIRMLFQIPLKFNNNNRLNFFDDIASANSKINLPKSTMNRELFRSNAKPAKTYCWHCHDNENENENANSNSKDNYADDAAARIDDLPLQETKLQKRNAALMSNNFWTTNYRKLANEKPNFEMPHYPYDFLLAKNRKSNPPLAYANHLHNFKRKQLQSMQPSGFTPSIAAGEYIYARAAIACSNNFPKTLEKSTEL